VENEAFYPVRAKLWPDFLSLLNMADFALRRSLLAVRSKHVTQQQLELTSVAQSLVQSRVSADAPRAMLIRAIVRACDDARALLRSRRTDALVVELELLRRYSTA
jgi:hypothetical protein